ncbi:MAG TPA: hypothetical protein DCM08_14115 [Microscillaceae bacterium]|nr:hypothetical protein [Microscillaceae bacterium]
MTQPALSYLQSADSRLASIIEKVELPIINSTQDVFFDLMSCVVEQQIHYRSTKKIFEKVLLSAEIEQLTLQNYPIFEETLLQKLKLSIQKLETVQAVYDFFKTNPSIQWHSLSNEEVRQQLSSIKGNGAWSIDMVLLFTLQRPDIFPADDFHLKQVMTQVYELNPASKLKSQMLGISAAWGTHTSLAVKYLWAWKKQLKSNN